MYCLYCQLFKFRKSRGLIRCYDIKRMVWNTPKIHRLRSANIHFFIYLPRISRNHLTIKFFRKSNPPGSFARGGRAEKGDYPREIWVAHMFVEYMVLVEKIK